MIPISRNEKERELAPAGNHVARLYSIVEIGHVPNTFEGKEGTVVHQVRLTWELPDELREFNGEQKPMVIGRTYTVSLGEKSNLRPIVDGMFGGLSEEEIEGFSFKDLVGKTCMLQVIHGTSKKTGKKYSGISSAAQLPKSMPEPKAFNEATYLDYREGWDEKVYTSLPQFMKESMAQSSEMQDKKINPEEIGF